MRARGCARHPSVASERTCREISQRAANVRALTRLSRPDALIVATAMLADCEAIVTNDERWFRRLSPLFPAFRGIYLGA